MPVYQTVQKFDQKHMMRECSETNAQKTDILALEAGIQRYCTVTALYSDRFLKKNRPFIFFLDKAAAILWVSFLLCVSVN